MTGSGEREEKDNQNAASSNSGAVANVPSKLALVIHIEAPPYLWQTDFKAHKRKSSDTRVIPKVLSPTASTSSQSIASSTDIPLVNPVLTQSPKKNPSSPKKAIDIPPKRQPIPRATPKETRPKSVFEIGSQRLSRDWYRPRSVTPTFFEQPTTSRTQHTNIRQDNSGLLFEKNISSSSGQQKQPQQQQPTSDRFVCPPILTLPLYGGPSKEAASVDSSAIEANLVNTPTPTRFGEKVEKDEKQLSSSMGVGGANSDTNEDRSAGSRILIKGGQVINDDSIFVSDIFVEDGIIKQVGPNLAVPGGARVIDVKGKYVLPGGIDAHTHFQLPFMGTTAIDDFYSGTKAALAGGTTTIIGSVLPQKGESLLTAYDKWRGWADSKVCCDYGLSIGVTHWSDKIGEEMNQLASQKGVNSFKFFMACKDWMLRDEEIYRGFQQCKRIGAVARVHAENGDLIAMKEKEVLAAGVTGPEGHLQSHPEEIEIEATTRACTIARQTNCPLYVLNVTSKGAADVIGEARRKGGLVIGESLAVGLITDGHHYLDKNWRHAAGYVLSPPLRLDTSTPKYLMQSLSSGDLQISASGHRAYNSGQKAVGKDDFTKIPQGVNGVEERMMVLWERGVNTGKMDMMKYVAVTSSNAAKIFNCYPKKGRIAEGSDADIVIWDPENSKTLSANSHHSQSDFNIFEGMTCRGIPFITIAGGKVVYEDGQLHVTQGAGKFVPLPPNSPHLFSSISQREHASRPFKIDRDSTSAGTKLEKVDNGSSNTSTAAPSPQMQRRSEPYVEPLMPTSPKSDDFHGRPLTKAGARNMQDSTFAISGAQIDDADGSKRSTRVSNPPGGKSRGLW